MTAYLLRRLALIPLTLGCLALGVMVLASLAPGDAAEAYARRASTTGEVTPQQISAARHQLGLDHPLMVQYRNWVSKALRGDLGRSYSRQTPVTSEIARRWGATTELALAGFCLSVVLAVPLGVVSALSRNRLGDHALRLGALTAASLPGFFLAYALIIVFARWLRWLPVAGRHGPSSVVLPALTLAVGPAAALSRVLRASLLEVMGEDYVRTARSKGRSPLATLVVHALPNAMIPVMSVLGGLLGYLLAGAVIAEYIFAWPGLGQLLLEAVSERDYPMIQGLVVFAGLAFLVVNLLVDLAYVAVDPRVRLQA